MLTTYSDISFGEYVHNWITGSDRINISPTLFKPLKEQPMLQPVLKKYGKLPQPEHDDRSKLCAVLFHEAAHFKYPAEPEIGIPGQIQGQILKLELNEASWRSESEWERNYTHHTRLKYEEEELQEKLKKIWHHLRLLPW